MLPERELAALLAALRFWQRHGPHQRDSIFDQLEIDEQDSLNRIRTDCGRFDPLDVEELDTLCDRLNSAPPLVEWVDAGPVCECELPGYFYSGVPGIICRVVDGRLSPGAVAERCDVCQRYTSDESALDKLRELGIA